MSIQCRHVSRTFVTRQGPIRALEDVTFDAGDREFVSVVGPSGCGKSTLLRILAGLLEPTSGDIRFEGYPDGGRPRSALVFQEHGLFPWMPVLENVAFGLKMRGVPRRERLDRAGGFLEKMGLSPFAHHHPHELSVGMRQRAGLARAFLADPDILLMDEPLGSVDAQTKLILQEELLRIWKEHEKLVVYVTHDIREAVLLGDRVLVMSGRPGRILEAVPVPLRRPRDLTLLERPDVNTLVRRIWRLIEDEVRTGLGVE
jgi:NitT/TauT family transport system ATP-binding protein